MLFELAALFAQRVDALLREEKVNAELHGIANECQEVGL
jgi:hypothetical protein